VRRTADAAAQRLRAAPGIAAAITILVVLVAVEAVGRVEVPPTAVVIVPLLAAIVASPWMTAVVGAVAAVTCGWLASDSFDDPGARAGRVAVVVAATGLAAAAAWDRERRNQELSRSREVAAVGRRIGLSLRAGGTGTWVYDARTGLTTWDDSLTTMHGLEPGAFDGRFESWIELVHPLDRDLVLSASDDAIAHREPYEVAYRVVVGDASVRWFEARGEPIIRRGRIVGTAGVVVDVTERMTVASALEESRATARRALHERDALGATFQQSLLPAPYVRSDVVEVVTAYWPGERHLLVGGDLYDAVVEGDRASFVIGDVTGHGPRAAALGAALRAAWRSAVLDGESALGALRSLHRMLPTEVDGPEWFATACAGDLRGGTLRIVRAGHPPPMLIDAGGVRVVQVDGGPPVGLGEPEHEAVVHLDGPSTLLLYTDGLIEGRAAPGADERFGVSGLERWLGAEVGPGGTVDDDVLRSLLTAVEEANGGRLADDAAILALRILPAAE